VASTFCGTPFYLAPELWRRQRYGHKADIWALGILLFEMMALQRPFRGKDMNDLMDNVLNHRLPPLPQHYSPQLREVCLMLLDDDSTRRPSIAPVFQLPYVQKLLDDFEFSVKTSAQIAEDLKVHVVDDIQDIRQTPLDVNSTAHTGIVSAVQQESGTFEGTVHKFDVNGGVWKERFLSLRDGCLYLARRRGEAESKPFPVSQIASIVRVPAQATQSTPGLFAINTYDQTIWLQAPTVPLASAWVQNIQQSMDIS